MNGTAQARISGLQPGERVKTPHDRTLGAWLFGIATNLIRRHHRDEARLYRTWERARDASLVDGGALTEDSGDQQRRLSAALGALRPGDRDVLLLVA